MKTRLLAALTAATALAAAGTAHALTVIDFEGDVVGSVAEGFSAAGFPELVFYSDLGAGLEIGDYGGQSDGKALAARPDDNGNFIRGEFTDGVHSFLSMTFGNDDPTFTNPGDRAVLTVFLAGTLVGQTFVVLNRNDVMDQTIGFTFGPFDSFTFAYTDAAGNPFTGGGGANVGLIEIIDNITFDTLAAAIPEPSAWGMMILGFGGVGGVLRRRRDMVAAPSRG
ncbi:PEPxxWA-CTERM sorting domain-containing protein [Phenylobacterium sp.]|uniref:PEPxxWA-CTERM sorting domain-containing protein n=1 Tax=Phenylobacterium sp. TaxID=1871053 RepID=UPI00301D4EC0